MKYLFLLKFIYINYIYVILYVKFLLFFYEFTFHLEFAITHACNKIICAKVNLSITIKQDKKKRIEVASIK